MADVLVERGIVPEDDYFHPHEPDPYWTESAAFSFDVPERSITGKLGMWTRPDVRHSIAAVVLFDPHGHEVYDCLHFNTDWWLTTPEGTDGTSADFPNGYRVELVEPLRRYRLHYEHDEVRFDLTWTAVIGPHALRLTGGARDVKIGTGHLEQIGVVRGTLAFAGQPEIAVDCYSLRDKSWGPRNYLSGGPNVANCWAAAEDINFHALTFHLDGEGQEGDLVGGFLTRDGRTADLADAHRSVTRRVGFHTEEFVLDAVDTLGRELSVRCRTHNALRWLQFPRQYVCWSQLSCEIDGVTLWGNDQEAFSGETARARFHPRSKQHSIRTGGA